MLSTLREQGEDAFNAAVDALRPAYMSDAGFRRIIEAFNAAYIPDDQIVAQMKSGEGMRKLKARSQVFTEVISVEFRSSGKQLEAASDSLRTDSTTEGVEKSLTQIALDGAKGIAGVFGIKHDRHPP